MKKMIAQNCGNGNIPIASGYVMNAKDGPPVATDETGKPVTSVFGDTVVQIPLFSGRNYQFYGKSYSRDINPRTENTTKPAKMLVEQFMIGTRMASLRTIQNVID